MTPAKQAALEAAGYRLTDAAEFLGLAEDERRIVELRVRLARGVRELRALRQLTQQQLAGRIGSTQARIAKVESGVGASLELMLRALLALGADVDVQIAPTPAAPQRPAASRAIPRAPAAKGSGRARKTKTSGR